MIPFYSWVKGGGVAGEGEGWGEVVFSNPRIPHIESCKFGALWSESSSYHMQSENNNLLCMHCTKLMVMLFLCPPNVKICRCTTYLKVSFKIIFVSLRRARAPWRITSDAFAKKGSVCLSLWKWRSENWTGGDNNFLPPFAVWEDAPPHPVLTVRRLSGFSLIKDNGAIENFLRHNGVCVSAVFFHHPALRNTCSWYRY